jgi:hypothetical protein
LLSNLADSNYTKVICFLVNLFKEGEWIKQDIWKEIDLHENALQLEISGVTFNFAIIYQNEAGVR